MSSTNKLTGVVVDIVRSDDGVVRLLPADRQLIPDTVSERQRLRLPEGQHTTTQPHNRFRNRIVSAVINKLHRPRESDRQKYQ